MSNITNKITFMLLCSLASFILSCKQSARDEILTEQQIELKRKRLIAGERLHEMLHVKDYEQVLQYLDTLYLDYPRDPQLFFWKDGRMICWVTAFWRIPHTKSPLTFMIRSLPLNPMSVI